ncbi:hypothetical protein RRF57_000132 [Xylaria bambusicola]|uniref:Uncharacterized protein n=1 Tax=Xylaria bambusicola TaxID=326684 RepID=A0AAN7UBM4_9PEZI
MRDACFELASNDDGGVKFPARGSNLQSATTTRDSVSTELRCSEDSISIGFAIAACYRSKKTRREALSKGKWTSGL